MSAFIWAGSILAILTYFPLWKQISAGEIKQNLLTWVLWGALDLVAAATIIVQNGSFLLPATYTIGSALTVLFIARTGNKTSWTWFESLVASLVVASMALWYASGDKVATIASTTAMLIAGVPQIIDAWKKPHEMPVLVYASYFAANCLSMAGGKSWSVEDRFYPATAAVFCLVLVALSGRKFLLKST
ncbi:MAG: hypothetical protein AAB692_03475 [Patescibacteria group bacterium]